MLLSSHSSFIRVNENIYHMYLPVVYDGNDFYIPVIPFLEILNKTKLPNALVDSSEEFIITTAPRYNVNNVSVTNKINGTVIKINTSQKFSKDVLAASITRGGWLNLTIAGAIVDSINLVESPLENPVVRIRTIQSKESAQISFLLKSKVDDFEIETEANHISIFLRTALAENANKIKEMRRRWLLDTIVIDAGHGGKDSGASGEIFSSLCFGLMVLSRVTRQGTHPGTPADRRRRTGWETRASFRRPGPPPPGASRRR